MKKFEKKLRSNPISNIALASRSTSVHMGLLGLFRDVFDSVLSVIQLLRGRNVGIDFWFYCSGFARRNCS